MMLRLSYRLVYYDFFFFFLLSTFSSDAIAIDFRIIWLLAEAYKFRYIFFLPDVEEIIHVFEILLGPGMGHNKFI